MAGILADMKEQGSELPNIIEFLRSNGWVPYNHHDNWVKESWTELEKESALFSTHKAYQQCILDNLLLSESVQILIKSLKEDKGLWISYQANIAMAFKDEYHQMKVKEGDIMKDEEYQFIHAVANNAAYNFLTLLTS